MRSAEQTRRVGSALAGGRGPRPEAALAALLAVPILLAACGGGSGGQAATAVPPTVAAANSATTAAAPTGAPRTVGELADRVDAAWAGVRSYRSVYTAEGTGIPVPAAALPDASPAASPAASPPAVVDRIEISREVLLPDRQRQERRAGGAVVSEGVAIGDQVFVRGAAAEALLPGADPAAWLAVDRAALGPAAADPLLARLAAPFPAGSPTAAVPDNLRPQELRPLGPVEVAGRRCEAYGAANTTELGVRIDLTFAIDADDRPCFVETRSGSAGGRETFAAYDLPLTIEPPAASTPVAASALPATPAGRD